MGLFNLIFSGNEYKLNVLNKLWGLGHDINLTK